MAVQSREETTIDKEALTEQEREVIKKYGTLVIMSSFLREYLEDREEDNAWANL